MEQRYTVNGMTCGHCVSAVEREVSGIPGVAAVKVDLDTQTVLVTSDKALDEAVLEAAITEAGYELVGPVSD